MSGSEEQGARLLSPSVPATKRIPSETAWNVRTMAAPGNDLGEMLLVMAKILPRRSAWSKIQTTSSDCQHSRGHYMLLVAMGCMAACQIAFTMELAERVQQFIGGILLAATAGTAYLLLCYIMCTCDTTAAFGDLLLQRSNPFAWQRDQLRFFLEVCSWMASVWYSYTMFHSELISVGGGALTAIALAVFSDFAAAYARVLEARLSDQSNHTRESVAWLKVGLSYVCVGYVLTSSWRNLHGFLFGDTVAEFQSVEELVVTYLLITLVGVSLIVASELLLLYEPTRNAGMILQSRIVDARRNWEQRTWRSLTEATAVVAATVLAYQLTQDMVLSLQIATLTGVAFILIREAISSNVLLFSRRQNELPADHWIKILPLVVMTMYFLLQVGTAIMNLIILPSSFGLILVWFVTVCALLLTIVALHDIEQIAAFNRRFGGRVCMATVTVLAILSCSGWPAVIFSTCLSWFCFSLSRECWNEIEARENAKVAAMKGTASQPSTGETVNMRTNVMTFVRLRYSYLYKRVKWTFIGIVILSIVDVCSTVFLILKQCSLVVSLSQFSACNVVVSTGVGYLTSTISHELRPEVLAQTGLRHFKNKWQLFPLHAFVESLVFLGVFIGTFAATSTVFSSLTLASLSGIIISVGGHWVRARFSVTVGNKARVQLTATCAIIFCLFLIAWMSFLCLFSIYHYIDSIEAAFCLASLAGVVFLASSELFLLWEPTREIGHILQSRVMHAKSNWKAEPLRSFLEVFTWLAVICGSFALYDDLLLALQLGTFSGITVTLSGEYYRRKRSAFLHWDLDNDDVLVPGENSSKGDEVGSVPATATSERPRALPAMLLFAYIGSGTFQWIFENIRSLEVTVLLASFAGFAFLCVADLLVQYKPTRWAGIILQDRFVRAKDNWHQNPVRSFVELGCFLGVIYGSYAIYGDLLVATQVGTVSGMLVTLIGEQIRSHARALPIVDDEDEVTANEKTQVLPLPVMSLLGLVGAIAFNIIYTHLRSIEVAFLLATASGVAFALLGDVFVIWKPTRKAGLILQDRVLYIRYNWKIHPVRSLLEIASCAVAWLVSYGYIWPKDLLVAVLVGTATGITMCICDELIVESVTKFEQKVLQRTATGRSADVQADSAFLALPYEVQFQIAHFLTPEDLLVARATCHRVNNMLRAESARYWLYASLRRKFGGVRRDSEGRIDERMRRQARSLIYEAITVVIPKIFSGREPTDVLTSGTGVSRALKWVYLNADWIRAQNLEPIPESHEGKVIRFTPGDVAFEVFRHMPDKGHLGIQIERDEDLSIMKIDVPVAAYSKIQADPISFVAAETLSDVDAFSNWHVAFVAFFAMTLIFIGQFSSDVLRQHVLPESFWWPG